MSWDSKKECRSFFRSLVTQSFAQGLVQNQQQLHLHLRRFMSSQTGVWGAYRALGLEASLDEVFQAPEDLPQILWVFPRMREGHLDFLSPAGFTLGPFGIWEPDEKSQYVPLTQMQGVLVPGLAFNKNGHRLGKGKGFYDKTLAQYSGMKVGIAFDFQISANPLPTDKHDVTVDYLITESGVVECRKYQE